ncbi:MAG: hypothetical protein ACYTX0_36405 [Nostoc sp.]
MRKISNCDRCLLYSHDPHIVCAVYPDGVDGNSCLDFRFDPNAQAEELWEPEGATYDNGELMGATTAEADATATARITRYPSYVYWQVSSVRV